VDIDELSSKELVYYTYSRTQLYINVFDCKYNTPAPYYCRKHNGDDTHQKTNGDLNFTV